MYKLFTGFWDFSRVFSNPFFSYSRSLCLLRVERIYDFFAVCDRSNEYDRRRQSPGRFSSFFLFSHLGSRTPIDVRDIYSIVIA
jgi:hypothetical protein